MLAEEAEKVHKAVKEKLEEYAEFDNEAYIEEDENNDLDSEM